jgi:hypothetical protein
LSPWGFLAFLAVVGLFLWRLEAISDCLERIERLLHDEIEREREAKLAEEGRDRQGRFVKQR